jgi:hypothetical protein
MQYNILLYTEVATESAKTLNAIAVRYFLVSEQFFQI